MNLLSVLLTGLLAGGVSCAAVQGSLLAGLVARHSPQPVPTPSGARRPKPRPADQPPAPSWADDLAPAGGFLAGKLVSHTLLGALLGLAGEVFALSAHIRTMMQLAA